MYYFLCNIHINWRFHSRLSEQMLFELREIAQDMPKWQRFHGRLALIIREKSHKNI